MRASLTCTTSSPSHAPSWRTDPVWYDGLAEKCVYEATRTIYGKPRLYRATAYTNKERIDTKTTCKSETDDGLEVFKHHWSEIVPTEKYDYRFSTMTYTRTDDMRAYKLTASTQEDCGASFKEIWRERERLNWFESEYFPGSGRREGHVDKENAVFFDALTLSLRDYDFAAPRDVELRVVPSQKDTHHVDFDSLARTIHFAGNFELDLPIGHVATHALELRSPDGTVEARYWFAADASAPMLHALAQYEGPQAITYKLLSLERTAYWKH